MREASGRPPSCTRGSAVWRPSARACYRLFQIAKKRGRTDEAIGYNGLVTSWADIARLADDLPQPTATATTEALF